MRFTYTFFAAWGVVMLIIVLITAGIGHPKALLGCVLFTAGFGFYALQGFAFEKRKKMPAFQAEMNRVLDILKVGSALEVGLSALASSYRVAGDATGVSLRGMCRVVDLSGPVVEVRIEAKDAKILHVRCLPKRDKEWREVISTLNTELPPDRTLRDWMGHLIDRK